MGTGTVLPVGACSILGRTQPAPNATCNLGFGLTPPLHGPQFNSTALIVATNDLAVECNEQLVDHTHNSLAEELDIAVTLLNYTIVQLFP